MPFSRVVKLVDDPRISWIDPTLMLSLLAFVLVMAEIRPRTGAVLIVIAFLSAGVGLLLHKVDVDRPHSGWYIIVRDPLELTLSLIWFWVCVRYFVKDGTRAVRWLAASVICELAIAIYLYFAMFGLLPAPGPVETYLRDYLPRQVLTATFAGVPRMAGTYYESPMFGLFMLTSLVVLVLALRQQRSAGAGTALLRAAVIASAVGAIASLSGQTILAAVVFLLIASSGKLWRTKLARSVSFAVALGLCVYGIQELYGRVEYEQTETSGIVEGRSIGEREFHTLYAVRILGDEPIALFTGVGPGRYGDYAAETHRFPSSVVPAVTPVEWLVGYGVFGLFAICLWLWKIGRQAWCAFGRIGVGAFAALLVVNAVQSSSWLWDPWFMSLAYLYAAGLLTNRKILVSAWRVDHGSSAPPVLTGANAEAQ